MKATIPIPCEGYYNRGFVALSVALSPLWFTYYILVQHDIELWSNSRLPYFVSYLAFSIIIGAFVLRFAPGGEGNMSLIAATPIAFYGFIIIGFNKISHKINLSFNEINSKIFNQYKVFKNQ